MRDGDVIQAVRWSPDGDAVRIIDQRRLPGELIELDLRTTDELCDAIATLAVRGAPAIGVAAALGLAAIAMRAAAGPGGGDAFVASVEQAGARIRATRPTAVNLPAAIDRMHARFRQLWAAGAGPRASAAALRAEATAILEEDRAMCRRIGEHGAPLIPDGARVLTHCNAGALATAGIGTALAPVYCAAEAGKRVEVFVDETRPLLQGSRLTAWELCRAGIPTTVLTDSMAAAFMRRGAIDLCIVGADRIARNFDVANKIGTYGVAVSANHHGLPFYVAAPATSFDRSAATGEEIVIEERAREEVTRAFGAATAPDGVRVINPAFDITPAALISAWVTDRGVVRSADRDDAAFGADE